MWCDCHQPTTLPCPALPCPALPCTYQRAILHGPFLHVRDEGLVDGCRVDVGLQSRHLYGGSMEVYVFVYVNVVHVIHVRAKCASYCRYVYVVLVM